VAFTPQAAYNTSLIITGASTSMTDEACSDSGNGTLFTIDDDTKNIFDPSVTFTVKSNGGAVSASNYTLRYNVGAIEFDSSQSGNTITISGSYLEQYTVIDGHATSPEFSKEALEDTAYGDGARSRFGGLKTASWSMSTWQIEEAELDSPTTTNEATLEEILLGSETRGGGGDISEYVVLSWSPSSSSTFLVRAWVIFTGDSIESPADGINDKTIETEIAQQDAAMSTQSVLGVDMINV